FHWRREWRVNRQPRQWLALDFPKKRGGYRPYHGLRQRIHSRPARSPRAGRRLLGEISPQRGLILNSLADGFSQINFKEFGNYDHNRKTIRYLNYRVMHRAGTSIQPYRTS